MSSTAVRVTWIPLNVSVVEHYIVHYSRLGIGNRRRQVLSGTVTFPPSASSGVVSGLQEGQQYQFSVSVSLSVNGRIFHGVPGASTTAIARQGENFIVYFKQERVCIIRAIHL